MGTVTDGFQCCGIEGADTTHLFTMNGTLNEIPACFLLDSGASCNFVNVNFLKKHGIPIASTQSTGKVTQIGTWTSLTLRSLRKP